MSTEGQNKNFARVYADNPTNSDWEDVFGTSGEFRSQVENWGEYDPSTGTVRVGDMDPSENPFMTELQDDKKDQYVVPGGTDDLEPFFPKSDNIKPETPLSGVITSLGSEVIGLLKNNAIKYNSLNAKDLNSKILACREDVSAIKTSMKTCILCFQDLNEDTRKKLAEKGITSAVLEDKLYGFAGAWDKTFDAISANIESIMKGMETTNDIDSDVQSVPISKVHTNPSSTIHSSNPSSDPTDTIIEENPIDTTTNVSLLASVVGTITFKEIVTLYETIGQGEGIQANLTGNYGLIGIIKEGDKYYYKLIDKDTNKVYYVEISEKIEIQTEIEQVLNIKENAMMLNSTEIGGNNFVKLADPNTLYFVQNEIENNGITFANVFDAVDGKDYYIPLSDSVELVSLESITTGITSNK